MAASRRRHRPCTVVGVVAIGGARRVDTVHVARVAAMVDCDGAIGEFRARFTGLHDCDVPRRVVE